MTWKKYRKKKILKGEKEAGLLTQEKLRNGKTKQLTQVQLYYKRRCLDTWNGLNTEVVGAEVSTAVKLKLVKNR